MSTPRPSFSISRKMCAHLTSSFSDTSALSASHGALPTPLLSILSPLFPMQRRGKGISISSSSRVPNTPPKLLSDEDSRPACPERSQRERAQRAEQSLRRRPSPLHRWSYHRTGILPQLNSFVCHSYENCRGVPSFFPFWNAAFARRLSSASGRPRRKRISCFFFPKTKNLHLKTSHGQTHRFCRRRHRQAH
jgi:hypothetical protein